MRDDEFLAGQADDFATTGTGEAPGFARAVQAQEAVAIRERYLHEADLVSGVERRTPSAGWP